MSVLPANTSQHRRAWHWDFIFCKMLADLWISVFAMKSPRENESHGFAARAVTPQGKYFKCLKRVCFCVSYESMVPGYSPSCDYPRLKASCVPWADSSWPLLGPLHLCTKAQVTRVHTPPHSRRHGNDGPRTHEKKQDPLIAAPTVSFVLPSWPAREVGCTTAFVGKRTGWATSAMIAVSGGKDQSPTNWCMILRGQ